MFAPTLAPADADEQARALCQALNAYGVTYLVFGSMAGRLMGVDLPTRDLKIVPAMGPANLQRMACALNAWRSRRRSESVRTMNSMTVEPIDMDASLLRDVRAAAA